MGKQAGTAPERAAQTASEQSTMNDAFDRATNLIQNNPNSTTGIGGSVLKNIPGTPANTLSGQLDVLKARVAVKNINQMRMASPTGGALGNVSDKDMAKMEKMEGDLEQSRDSRELLYNIQRMKRAYNHLLTSNGLPDEPGLRDVQHVHARGVRG